MQRRRILLEDARGADRHLRVTWHPDARQFNVSTWHGDVCSGAVRLGATDAAQLVALLADGMADAATGATPPPTAGGRPRWRIWVERGAARLRRAA